MAAEYIEHSIEVMEQIRSGGLKLYPEVTHIDGTGSCTFASIGEVELDGDTIPVGVKFAGPYDAVHASFRNRLRQEMIPVSLIYDRAPSLRPRLPEFMGQVMVAEQLVAVITEDATGNGSYPIYSSPAHEKDVQILREVFPESEFGQSVVDVYELRRTLNFEVNGIDRWLDFAPSPFNLGIRSSELFSNRAEYIFDREPHLTFEIGSLEELGIPAH